MIRNIRGMTYFGPRSDSQIRPGQRHRFARWQWRPPSPKPSDQFARPLGGPAGRALVAVLATLRTDGTFLLSPVYHEWREGGFNVWVEKQNVKARHLRRDPRATILVAESDPPLRAIEVRGSARFIEEGVSETALRIATRYLGQEEGAADVEALRGTDVIVRIEPGDIRVWDYVDEYSTD
jgi:PPOX class probable F420-dependent enzyme